MLVIIAHHYVVNSGLLDLVNASTALGKNDIFLLLFGWGGKTGINCFVLITGYFMCKSNITARKFGRLLGELMFYHIVIYAIFLVTGYSTFSMDGFLRMLFPFFYTVNTNFTSCFLYFYLFIPFLNKLLQALNEKEHLMLTGLCLFIYTILPSFMEATVTFNYVVWFGILYLIASFIRLYPKEIFGKTSLWGILSTVSLLLSWGSVLLCTYQDRQAGISGNSYFYVADSNKILAVVTGICLFLFFKNVKVPQSKFINTVASSCFGVLLIHANSDTMRQWLWKDLLNNTGVYNSPLLPVHAAVSVLCVFAVCVVIDQMRMNLLEKPVMRKLDKRRQAKSV